MAGGGGSQLGLPTVNNMYASPTAAANASAAYTANAPTTGNTGSPFGNTIAATNTVATPGYASPPDIASLERDLSNLNTIISDDQRANTNIHDGFNQGIASLTDRIGEAGKTLDSHVGVPRAHHELPGGPGGWDASGQWISPPQYQSPGGSDYRLKENIEPLEDAIDRLMDLKPSRFNFIADPDETVDGFIAHEAQEIVPESVLGEKDAVDGEGNPEYQRIDQSRIVPLLVGAVQELVKEVRELKEGLNDG